VQKIIIDGPSIECSKRVQEKRQNVARKVHNNMTNPKVQNEFLI
jgi:hypothetical protein